MCLLARSETILSQCLSGGPTEKGNRKDYTFVKLARSGLVWLDPRLSESRDWVDLSKDIRFIKLNLE